MNSFKRFKEDSLPDIDCFFNSLKHRNITNEEYQRAINVWKIFDIQNLGGYHDLYLKTDVLLLCDVFEKFTDVCMKDYGLDPYHYFSICGLSWDSMLKFTGIKLEKINNIDIHLFIEKGMRGGISYNSKRYSKNADDINIMYWDASNLYGWAMSNHLPNEGFKFLNEEEINDFDLDSINENSPIGYILEVDLEYPSFLHEKHNDYSLCPEHDSVEYEMLSKYCEDIVDRYDIKVGGVKKLIPNLYDKTKYIIHYKSLKYYLGLGMKLVKIHRILCFKQWKWLKSYCNFSTKKR